MRWAVAVAALLIAAPAAAQGDSRLRTVAYLPDTVVTVRVVPGYVAAIILNPDERIESIASGNSGAWDVSPSKSGDHLFVKPLVNGVTTNVAVVTDSRHYSFVLQTSFEGDPEATFQLRFDYAGEAMPVPTPTGGLPAVATAVAVPPGRYRLSGDRLARPIGVADDGVRTIFAFDDKATLPAIYAIDDQGRETLVTVHRVADGWQIERVWKRYVLRLGKAAAHVVRHKATAR